MSKSRIEWTERTWNPVTGCTKVSPGCQNCYAERMARRLAGRYGYPESPRHFDVTVHENMLMKPLEWQTPLTIFVCSMGDLFHPDVHINVINDVFSVMDEARLHTFQVLTKRPERAREFYNRGDWDPPSNVWLGVSAENQETADERIPILLDTPAAVRFVSLEPLLGPVDLARWLVPQSVVDGYYEVLQRFGGVSPPPGPIGPPQRLDWIIVGCESGANRRPCNIDWIREIRDQCVDADTPCFVKQMELRGKIVKMPKLDGKVWDQMPEEAANA